MIDVAALDPGPLALAQALGLAVASGARPDRCRVRHHGERVASCDVGLRDGRTVWICRSCGVGGDHLALAADAWGLDPRRDFRDVAGRLADLLGVRLEDGPRPSVPPVPRDPAIDLAIVLDALADAWIAGRQLRAADLERVDAAGADAAREALAILQEHDEAAAEFGAQVDDELDRLADAYQARHRDCECSGGTRPHAGS